MIMCGYPGIRRLTRTSVVSSATKDGGRPPEERKDLAMTFTVGPRAHPERARAVRHVAARWRMGSCG